MPFSVNSIFSALIEMTPPLDMASLAFSSRLVKTWRIWFSSTSTSHRSSGALISLLVIEPLNTRLATLETSSRTETRRLTGTAARRKCNELLGQVFGAQAGLFSFDKMLLRRMVLFDVELRHVDIAHYDK